MGLIKNKRQLIEKGETEFARRGRAMALCSFEIALNIVEPGEAMKSKVSLDRSILHVENYSFDLQRYKNVYVIGGGKASGLMAVALEKIIGEWITKGIVNIPRGNRPKTDFVVLNETSHPIPDEAGVEGVRQMLEIAEQAEEGDLIICLISGGGSSLMPMPRKGLTLKDKQRLTDALLKSGAKISEINTVRKHLSDFKGGLLAKKGYPAKFLNIILSDVMGDQLDLIASGPTVPDGSTFFDAQKVLSKYTLWDTVPSSISNILANGQKGLIPETPKADDVAFKKVYSTIIGNNRSASLAACKHLRSQGMNTLLLTTTLEGEARCVGTILASFIREISVSNNPIEKPAVLVAGGETTVTVTGKGLGGRNQELALAAALQLKGLDNFVLASLNTDGLDGPTDAAGAIIDGSTLDRAVKRGLNPESYISENNSYCFFSELDDLVLTGQTGTNVNDITIIIVE